MENRRSRASFTRSLQRICQRIDKKSVFDTDWRDDFFGGAQHSRLRVRSVWVAGSYARGALQCGDLDLVADIIAEEGLLPFTSTISRCVIGGAPDVRLYIGSPEKNSSGIVFPEAKLLWSADQSDWNAAIEAILAEATATRYRRPHDILPLRKEQTVDYGDEDTFGRILDLLGKDVLSSQWVPLSDINVKADRWSPAANVFFEKIAEWCGKRTQVAIPYVIEWFTNNNRCDLWHKNYNESRHFKIGGAKVLVGRPCIDLTLLDSLSCSSVVVVPHLSRRGPNGLWILSRGTNHPVNKKFASCKAYYLTYEGCPSICEEIDGWQHVHSFEFFRQQEQAAIRLRELNEDDDPLEIASAAGSTLLSLIAAVDIIEVDSDRYPITQDGRYFERLGLDGEDKPPSEEEVVSALTHRLKNGSI